MAERVWRKQKGIKLRIVGDWMLTQTQDPDIWALVQSCENLVHWGVECFRYSQYDDSHYDDKYCLMVIVPNISARGAPMESRQEID